MNPSPGAHLACSLLLAHLALLVSFVPLLLLVLLDESRAVLLHQAHLDGAVVAFRAFQPCIVSLHPLHQT